MEEVDLTHNSKKAWTTIRKLTNDPTKAKAVSAVTANEVAYQLILNGKGPAKRVKKGDVNSLVVKLRITSWNSLAPSRNTTVALNALNAVRHVESTTSQSS